MAFTPTRQIGVGCAEVSAKAKEYVLDTLDKNRLSYGPYLSAFETRFAADHGLKYAMFCNSGTSALQVGLNAMKLHYGWPDGAEVLVPAVTFIASSNVVIQNNLRPVFVDVEPDYYELDPAQIEAKISAKTVAIMPVHLFGQPCDMEPILAIAQRHQLRVIEDSCETMFVRYKGAYTGSWGDVSCFSTYVAHLLVTGVGGLACTANDELAVLIKSLMNHGRDGIYLHIDDDQGQAGRPLFDLVARRFSFTNIGYSYRGTEMEGALGLAELELKDEILASRQRNAASLTQGLSDLSQYLQLPKIRPATEHAFMMYPIVVKEPIKRDELVNFLEERLIETRPMLPLLNQPIYIKLFGNLEDQYPTARLINHNGFYIGCHQALRPEELEYIISILHQFIRSVT